MSSSRLCHLNKDLQWFLDIYFQGRSTSWKHTIEGKYTVFFFLQTVCIWNKGKVNGYPKCIGLGTMLFIFLIKMVLKFY